MSLRHTAMYGWFDINPQAPRTDPLLSSWLETLGRPRWSNQGPDQEDADGDKYETDDKRFRRILHSSLNFSGTTQKHILIWFLNTAGTAPIRRGGKHQLIEIEGLDGTVWRENPWRARRVEERGWRGFRNFFSLSVITTFFLNFNKHTLQFCRLEYMTLSQIVTINTPKYSFPTS